MLKNKEELENNLKNSSNPELKEYLKSLLELEFSVVKPILCSEDQTLIADVPIYQDIALYNIYYRAIKLAQKLGLDINEQTTKLLLSKDNYSLYDFDFNCPEEKIGIIKINQTLDKKNIRKMELNRQKRKLRRLQRQNNPHLLMENEMNLYGGQSGPWALNHAREIKLCQNKIQELKHKKLTDAEKREIEITNKVYEAFMNDYGLTEDCFQMDYIDVVKRGQYFSRNPMINEKITNETFINENPNLTLEIHKKYL